MPYTQGRCTRADTQRAKRRRYFFTRSNVDATRSIVFCTCSRTSCIDCSRSRKLWDFSFCNSNAEFNVGKISKNAANFTINRKWWCKFCFYTNKIIKKYGFKFLFFFSRKINRSKTANIKILFSQVQCTEAGYHSYISQRSVVNKRRLLCWEFTNKIFAVPKQWLLQSYNKQKLNPVLHL